MKSTASEPGLTLHFRDRSSTATICVYEQKPYHRPMQGNPGLLDSGFHAVDSGF